MVAPAFVRQFAVSQGIDLDVADQEIVLHYALVLLNEGGLVGPRRSGGDPGPLLFKGGTALRKCVFGTDSIDLELQDQPYFKHVEPAVPTLHGLDPYEMIGEKIMACSRRIGGSGKDVYDLYLWADRPFDESLVRLIATLKAWTDRRRQPRYDPEHLLASIEPESFRWTDIATLVPRRLTSDPRAICDRVRMRFSFLKDLTPDEATLLDDQVSHREHRLFRKLRQRARKLAAQIPR